MLVMLRARLVVVVLALIVPVAGPVAAAAPSLFPLAVNAEWTRKNDDGTASTSKVRVRVLASPGDDARGPGEPAAKRRQHDVIAFADAAGTHGFPDRDRDGGR